MNSSMLKIENVSKIYPNGTKANDQINLEVYPGEIVGIIGPNGSGKTTLLRQVLGLLKPSEGRIFLKGSNVADNRRADPHFLRQAFLGIRLAAFIGLFFTQVSN